MTLNLKTTICLLGFTFISFFSFAQRYNQGIGLRVGDPLGLTYKIYGGERQALEFTLGSVSRNRHGAYYEDKFDAIDDFDDFRYSDHDVDYTYAIQGRYLVHNSFPANVEGRLDWFWGLGAHLRLSRLEYSYFDQDSQLLSDTRTNFDLGPEGILGVEYELQDYPIVGFGEVSLLAEIVDQPLKMRIFGAIGVRYAF